MKNKKPTAEEIRKHYKWLCEHCKRFKKETIPYKQFKKDFIKTWEFNQTPEEQKRLNSMKMGLNNAMELLK